MNDLISRQAAIDVLERKKDKNAKGDVGGFYNKIIQNDIDALMQLPSAEPHWILCNERLPEDDRSKVVTLANGNTECGYYSNGDWWCIGDTISLENPTVIAWMPLPKPYEVEEE